MSLSVVHSRCLVGLQAPAVTVEVHLANGLPSFTLVGLADTEVKEARERVRCAIQNAGLSFPSNKRITVNLAPADLPKDSGRFDLPIAMGILAASGVVDARHGRVTNLRGSCPCRGAAPGARRFGHGAGLGGPRPALRLVLPTGQRPRGRMGARHIKVHGAQTPARRGAGTLPRRRDSPGRRGDWPVLTAAPPTRRAPGLDMAEVKGQAGARRALQIAAAGGHSVLMMGPPGQWQVHAGAALCRLAARHGFDRGLESAAVASLVGRFAPSRLGAQARCAARTTRPLQWPWWAAVRRRAPGEISLAHHGVLFLDELPEFPRSALEALREPLESGRITIRGPPSKPSFRRAFSSSRP
jgi:magnesium chelatase family protein